MMLKEPFTIAGLQAYIQSFDHRSDRQTAYFLKLSEEVGELAEAIRNNARLAETGYIKGTIEEELSDVLYYVIALANVYDIDLEHCFKLKDEINKVKWNR